MASVPTLPDDQLIELVQQLKKTTPDQARAILNAQPQISYAVMALLVKMNAINVEILTKHLISYGVPTGPSGAQASASSTPVPRDMPSAPPPLAPAATSNPYLAGADPRNAYRTPSTQPPTGPSGSYPPYPGPQAATPASFPSYPNSSAPNLTAPAGPPAHPQGYNAYGSYGLGNPPQAGGYGRQPPGYAAGPPAPAPPPAIPEALANLPDEQKALIMRVVTMTPEEIHRLPPQERASMIQLRATLGLSTG